MVAGLRSTLCGEPENVTRGGVLDKMMRGPEYTQGMEAITSGLEAEARGAEQQNEQQRTMIYTWQKQLRTNMIMTKGDTMVDCPKMVKNQNQES